MDEVTIKLPVSNVEVVLRNYTTRKDDDRADSVMYAGVTAVPKAGSDPEVVFPIANMMASKRSYIPRLVKSIDGSSENLIDAIDNLRSEDYEVLEEAVSKIVEEHSPKVKKAATVSTPPTPKK